jgi:hypothetical protein
MSDHTTEPGRSIVSRTVQHGPSDECQHVHCDWHNVDEPDRPAYLICGECGSSPRPRH